MFCTYAKKSILLSTVRIFDNKEYQPNFNFDFTIRYLWFWLKFLMAVEKDSIEYIFIIMDF